jgi:hypothetical protein
VTPNARRAKRFRSREPAPTSGAARPAPSRRRPRSGSSGDRPARRCGRRCPRGRDRRGLQHRTPSSRTSTVRTPSSSVALTVARVAPACLTTLTSASATMKYALASMLRQPLARDVKVDGEIQSRHERVRRRRCPSSTPSSASPTAGPPSTPSSSAACSGSATSAPRSSRSGPRRTSTDASSTSSRSSAPRVAAERGERPPPSDRDVHEHGDADGVQPGVRGPRLGFRPRPGRGVGQRL